MKAVIALAAVVLAGCATRDPPPDASLLTASRVLAAYQHRADEAVSSGRIAMAKAASIQTWLSRALTHLTIAQVTQSDGDVLNEADAIAHLYSDLAQIDAIAGSKTPEEGDHQ